jgi:SAM-dependent methyltransferase
MVFRFLFGKCAMAETFSGEPSGEKDAAWYDRSFLAGAHWRAHYTASAYYFVWCVLVDRMTGAGVRSVLEVGCGSGQFACLLRDKGLREYWGIDFSGERVRWAQAVCPEFRFAVEDVFRTRLFESTAYDAVVSNEFLEHVERDLEVLKRIRPGVRFYGTVPNFPYVSHVRHFAGCEEVRARYGPLFADFRVEAYPANDRGQLLFALDGVKR